MERFERYCFNMSTTFKTGKPEAFVIREKVDLGFLPNNIYSNVPEPGCVILESLKVNDIEIFNLPLDLFHFSANFQYGSYIPMPAAKAGSEFIIAGKYTGKKPKNTGYPWWKFWKRNSPFNIAFLFVGTTIVQSEP